MQRTSAVTLALFALVPGVAFAGGFEINEQSPSSTGLAGSMAARADDASAVYYNPAGMAMQRGLSVIAGITLFHAELQVSAIPGEANYTAASTPVAPSIFIVDRLGDHFAVGFGIYSPYGIVLNYPATWAGRYLGLKNELKTVMLNPSVAIRPMPWISVGFGLDVMLASIDIAKALNFGGGDGRVEAGLTGTSLGGNIGVHVQVVPRILDVGLTYRSKMSVDLSGDVALTVPPELATMVAGSQKGSVTLNLPESATFAVATHPIRHLTISTDLHYAGWSTLQDLTLKITDPKNPMAAPQSQSVTLRWRDSYGVRAGIEYRALDESLRVRVGLGYDMTPARNETNGPLGPDTDAWKVGVGLGYLFPYRHNLLGLEAGYMASIHSKQHANNPDFAVDYSNLIHVVSVGFVLHFDRVGPHIESEYR